jgi:hypothetical protein
MRHREGLRLRKLLVFLVMTTAISSAHADDALDDRACRELGPPGSPNYRECRSLLILARSSHPYYSAMAQAGLLRLQQRVFEDMRRRPSVSPAPAYPGQPPAFECQTYGDEMGGGITRCY